MNQDENKLTGQTSAGETQRPRSRARKNSARAAQATVGTGTTAATSTPAPKTPDVKKVSGKETVEKAPKQVNKKALGITAGIVGVLAIGGIGAYAGMAQKYNRVFFPNTTINGVNASGKTVAEVEQLISAGTTGYTLEIQERGDVTEQLTGESIGLNSVFDGSLEKLLEEQNPYAWLGHQFQPENKEIKTMVEYDQEKFQTAVQSLKCLDPDEITKPEDAYVSDYIPGAGYQVVPAVQGNQPDEAMLAEGLSNAVINLQPTVSLEELQCYEAPSILEDNADLIAKADKLNQYLNVTITYSGSSRVVNGDVIHEWLTVAEDGTTSLNQDAVKAYVKELAGDYDTSYKAKQFKSTASGTVTITGGSYGWKVNQAAEAEALTNLILNGESATREPEYSRKAASHGETDYGNTYVEINLTGQHLYFYKDGRLVVDSDFVSGNVSKGYTTPAGAYSITYKQRNATLKGQGYATPVSYWMPFNNGIGLHDATWRSSFGGNIYKTNGSHGCINLPAGVAKTIYENISAGVPVLCYNTGGSGSNTTTSVNNKPAAATAAATQPATEAAKPAETPAATAPAETTAAATKPAVSPGTVGPSTETTAASGPGATTEAAPAATKPAETAPAQTSVSPGVVSPGSVSPGSQGESSGGSYGPGGASSDSSGSVGPGM